MKGLEKNLEDEYKESAALLRNRISELSKELDLAIMTCRRAHKDPEEDATVNQLCERIRPLRNMLNDLQEVTKEIKHYYDRWWYRSGKFTFNKNKPGPSVYAG